MEMNGGTRTTEQILRGTLAELMDREEKLAAFVDEHAKVRHAIGTIEKALTPKASTVKGGKASGRQGEASPRAQAVRKVAGVLSESIEPIGLETIADLTGLKNGAWLAGILKQMISAGDAAEISDGKFGLPVTALSAME